MHHLQHPRMLVEMPACHTINLRRVAHHVDKLETFQTRPAEHRCKKCQKALERQQAIPMRNMRDFDKL